MKAWFRRRWALTSGGVSLALALLLLVAGERAVMHYRAASARHGGVVMDLGRDARPQSGQYGHMLRVVGTPRVVEPPRDPLFGVSAPGTRLQRIVEMFQWHELRMGGEVYYQQDWVGHPVDSSRFLHPRGHRNAVPFPFRSTSFLAHAITLDGFALAPKMLGGINGDQPVTPRLSSLPPNLAASFQLHDGALVTSTDPGSPQIGDLRVRWQVVPVQPVTVIARADGGRLVPAARAGDGAGYQVDLGDLSLSDVLPDLPARPHFVWPRRVLVLLLAWAGLLLLAQLRWPGTKPWLSALAAAVALDAGVAAALWIGTALVAGLVLAGVAALALAVLYWLLRGRAA